MKIETKISPDRLSSLFLFLGLIALLVFRLGKKICHLKVNNPRNIHGVISYKRSFGDLNDIQLVAARTHGIIPLNSRKQKI